MRPLRRELRKFKPMKAVVKAAILAAIAIAGSALAAFLYIEDTNTLEDLSRDAFVGSFGPVITSAMSAATSHVQVGLLMADALAALGTLPSNSQIQRVSCARCYVSCLEASPIGLKLVAVMPPCNPLLLPKSPLPCLIFARNLIFLCSVDR